MSFLNTSYKSTRDTDRPIARLIGLTCT